MEPREIEEQLARYTSSQNIYEHTSGLNYTDGIKFLATSLGAYWFIDLIASWQKRARKDRMLRDFQIWELRVDLTAHTAVAVCLRDTSDEAFRQTIAFTDFPLETVRVYLENETLSLPSER
jgi:hypothetical protein